MLGSGQAVAREQRKQKILWQCLTSYSERDHCSGDYTTLLSNCTVIITIFPQSPSGKLGSLQWTLLEHQAGFIFFLFWAMKWFLTFHTSDFSSSWQIWLIIFWVFTFYFLLPISGWILNLLRSSIIFSLSLHWFFFLTNKDLWKTVPTVFLNGVVQ